jgi:hypothetical protein
MFGNVLTAIMLKRAGRLVAMSAFAALLASNGNAADLRLPVNVVPRHEKSSSRVEARKVRFEQFLEWLRERQQR